MFTAIDYNSYENKVIEERVRDNYQEIKGVFETVLMRRIKDPYSPVGLCADLIDVSKTWRDEFLLWRDVIKPWFTPQRFNITELYFGYYNHTIAGLGEIIVIDGKVWYRVYLKSLKRNGFLLGTAFWFPVSKDYNAERIKILECALEDLERIKREGEPKLPPITFEEPKIYP